MKKFLLSSFAALMMLASCGGQKRPEGVMSPETMVTFLVDAYQLEGFYAIETEYRYDSLLPEVAAAYDDLLARHGVSREEVERSFDYYAAHPEHYSPIQDSVMAHLDRTADADTLIDDSFDLDYAF